MGTTLGILFLHHDTDIHTRRNLASIRRQNPGAKVVTVSAGKPFHDGYTLDATPEIRRMHERNPSRSTDWLVCSWHARRKEEASRWWIAEWDTYARISVQEYYRPVWKEPFVASSIKLPYREPEWSWFRHIPNLPEQLRSHGMGAVPFIYLVSERALDEICRTLLQYPAHAGNGELRFATAASKCGFPPCGYSPPNDRITWIRWNSIPRERAIFHPVKELRFLASPSRTR